MRCMRPMLAACKLLSVCDSTYHVFFILSPVCRSVFAFGLLILLLLPGYSKCSIPHARLEHARSWCVLAPHMIHVIQLG